MLSRRARLRERRERTPAPHACSIRGNGCSDEIPCRAQIITQLESAVRTDKLFLIAGTSIRNNYQQLQGTFKCDLTI
ncbi:MAG: hypothetical protein ACFFD2_10585 [Promethearchaeota archaeon]